MNVNLALPILVDQLVANGLQPDQAKVAADRCVKAIFRSGIVGYYAGQLSGPALWAVFINPAAAAGLIGAGGAVAVASMAYQVGYGNSCSEVRAAALNWSSGVWDSALEGL